MSTASEARIVLTAQDRTQAVFAQAQRNLTALSAGVSATTGLLRGLGSALAIGTFIEWGRQVINSLDALNDLKDATGASIENISALEDVAARTGTSFETVGTALVKFNQALSNAKPGTEVAAAFQALGLSVEQLKTIDPAEALRQTAVALSRFADDGNKARVIQELFGKGAREIAPFLNDLAQQIKLVGTVTTEQTEAAEKFNQQLSAMQKNALDLSRVLLGPLVNGVNELADRFREGERAGKSFFDVIRDRYAEQNQRGRDFLSGLVGRASPQAPKFLLDYDQTAAETKRLQRQAAKPSLPPSLGGTKPAKKEEISDAQRYLDTLQKQLESASELTAVEKVRQDLAQGRIKLTLDEQRQAEFLAGMLDADKARKDQAREEAKAALELQRELTRQREQDAELARRHLESLAKESEAVLNVNRSLAENIEEMGLTAEQLDRLRLARVEATLAETRAALAIAENVDHNREEAEQLRAKVELLERQRDLVERQGQRRVQVEADRMSEDAAKSLHDDVKSALSNAFRDSKNPVRAFAEGLGNVVYTRLTNALGNSIADALVGTGKPGSSGGILTSLFSLFPQFATGTDFVPRDMVAMVHRGERIVPASQNLGGEGGQPVNITINNAVSDYVTMDSMRRNNQQLVRLIRAELAGSIGRGGALS